MNELKRLPNGETTKDVDAYVDAWTKFAEPLAKATGTELCSFDPTVSLANKNWQQIQLPFWFVEAFNHSQNKDRQE